MPTLLHLEFQAGPDPTMGRRVWEYNTEASIRHEQPVKSVVIYLKTLGSPHAKPPYQLKLPNGEIIHNFSFSIIELRKLTAEQLFQTGLKGVLPLVPLTQQGQRHDAIERVIDEIQQPGVKRQEELLSLTYGLAGLAFKEENDHFWLRKRFAMLKDILEESWTFQEIRQEALEKGREQMLQGLKQNLILLIQTRYPALLQLAQDACDAMQMPEEMQNLFQNILLAKEELDVRQHLLSAQK